MTVIEHYIHEAPAEHQAILNEVYQLIKKLIPDATEKISYGMPTFYFHENLVHFAAAKKHLGFYPTPSAIAQFQEELINYPSSKGAVQFVYTQPLPTELIKKMVLFRKEEIVKKLELPK